MFGRPLRTIACASLAVVLVALSPVRAQNLQPRPERDCGEIERDYELIKAEAVSVQINMALFAAADKGCEALARKLLDAGASPLARDRRGAGPLAHAARGGQIKLVELFLAKGAPIDARNVDGGTALFAAAEAEKHSTVALLLTKGADPNLPGRKGVTPLMAAAFKGNGRIFDALLQRSADPNVRDETGKTAMVYAASRGFDDIVGRLIDAGVDPRTRYGNDLTALMWAAGHDEGVGAAAVGRVVDLLVAHGASLDDTDNRGRTALMIAAGLGDCGRGRSPAAARRRPDIEGQAGQHRARFGSEPRRAGQARGEVTVCFHPHASRGGGQDHIPASHAAIAAISGSVSPFMNPVMPGLLSRAPVRKSVIVFCR